MKIVFLTRGCSHGAKQLAALQKAGVPIAAILFGQPASSGGRAEAPPGRRLAGKWATFRRLLAERRWKKIAERLCENLFGRRMTQRLSRLCQTAAPPPWRSEAYYHAFSDCVRVVEGFNAPSTAELLTSLKPDLVILGGTPILRKPILSVPRIGTLNAHPGLLPAYRGVDVIPWAILNGDPVGVTAHFVDTGVDTGSILLREELPIGKLDTLESLRAKAEDLAARLTVKSVAAIREGTTKPISQEQTEKKQYYRMTRKELRCAREKLKERQRET